MAIISLYISIHLVTILGFINYITKFLSPFEFE